MLRNPIHFSNFLCFLQQYPDNLLSMKNNVCNDVSSKDGVLIKFSDQNVIIVRNIITSIILDVNQPEESGDSARRGAQH